jgi:hypothetical protein
MVFKKVKAVFEFGTTTSLYDVAREGLPENFSLSSFTILNMSSIKLNNAPIIHRVSKEIHPVENALVRPATDGSSSKIIAGS